MSLPQSHAELGEEFWKSEFGNKLIAQLVHLAEITDMVATEIC